MLARRVLGCLAGAAVFAPSMLLILWSSGKLPLPFVVALLVGSAAIVAALKLAYLVRSWVDPSFDPALSAHRGSELFDPVPPRSKR